MKITKKTIAALLTAVPLFMACQQTDEIQPVDRQSVALRLTSGIIGVQTRAVDASWESGDEIGVFTTSAETQTVTYSGTQLDENMRYITTGTTGTASFTAVDGDIYLPVNGNPVDVYAYYPYSSTVNATTPLSFTIPADQSAANAPATKTYDVMKGSAKSTTLAPIDIDHETATLSFTHCLSKVLIKLKVSGTYTYNDIYNKVNSIQLTGQPTAATFAPVSQELTISTASETIKAITAKLLESSDPDYEAYDEEGTAIIHTFRAFVMPNDATSNPANTSIDVTVNPHLILFNIGAGAGVEYKYPITYTLRAGYQTTFTITLGPTGIKVDATIVPWSTDGTSGVISPQDPYDDED